MTADLEQQILELSQENNRLLRKLDRRARWANVGSAIKWLVYFGLLLGAFVWLQPYLEAVLGGYEKLQALVGGGSGSASDPTFADQFRGFIKSL